MKTRFAAACGLLLLLFWWFLFSFLSDCGHGPRIQAAFRGRPDWGVEAVWKYTGPRPAEDERLVLYGRQGIGGKNAVIALTAYLADPGKPPAPAPVFHSFQAILPDIFTFEQMTVPPWPEGKDLYVGCSWDLHAPIWWERGPSPNDFLDPKPLIRRREGSIFIPGRWEEFGALDVRIVPADKAVAQIGPPNWPRASSRFRPPWNWLAVWAIVALAGTLRLPGYRTHWLMYNAFLGVLLWKAMEAILPNQFLWGGFFLERMGARAFWAGLLLLQVLTFPPLAAAWRRVSVPIWKRLSCLYHPWELAVILPVVTAGLCVAFWHFPVRMMYGDGFGPLAAPGYDYHNPLALAFYRVFRELEPLVTHFLNAKLGTQFLLQAGYADTKIQPYFLILFSPLFILGTWGIAWEIGRSIRERLTLWAILLTGKTILLQFQYIEVYGPAVAVTAITVWLILRAYLKHKDVVLCTVAAFFTYLFHMSFAPALPIIALLWFRRAIAFRFHPGWWLPRLLGVLVFAGFIWLNTLLALFVLKHHYDLATFTQAVPERGLAMLKGSTGLPPKQVFLQWSDPHSSHFYTLPTWEHFSQWAGALLFLTGPVLLWIALAASRRVKVWARTGLGWGFLLGALAFFAASFFLATSFPNPKDWDVFSEAWVIWIVTGLLFVIRFRTLPPHVVRWTLLALLLYQLWDTGLWLAYNLAWAPPMAERLFVFY